MVDNYQEPERRKVDRGTAPAQLPAEARNAVEDLMDETLDESFPASDPPAWGSAGARLRRLRSDTPR
jgi:hypothetical protein